MEDKLQYTIHHLTDVFIENDITTVWQTLCNIKDWHTWQPNILRAAPPESIAVGQSFTYKHRSLGISATVTQIEPQSLLVWQGSSFLKKFFFRWELSPSHNGTHVILRGATTEVVTGFFAKAKKKLLKKDLITWTITLKCACED